MPKLKEQIASLVKTSKPKIRINEKVFSEIKSLKLDETLKLELDVKVTELSREINYEDDFSETSNKQRPKILQAEFEVSKVKKIGAK